MRAHSPLSSVSVTSSPRSAPCRVCSSRSKKVMFAPYRYSAMKVSTAFFTAPRALPIACAIARRVFSSQGYTRAPVPGSV